MLRVGLTGGIGSGKSEVARRLAAHGAVVIDADAIAREVVAPGTPGLAEVVAAFGPGVLRRTAAWTGPARRPRVRRPQPAGQAQRDRAPAGRRPDGRARAAAPAASIVVHDVPLLVENDLAAGYDVVVVVDAPPRIQADRLVRHRGMTGSRPRPGWPPRPAGTTGWPSPTS